MIIQARLYELELIDDLNYSSDSANNTRSYYREYSFCREYQPTSKYGIKCLEMNRYRNSCVLLASAGATRVNDNSAVIVNDCCYVAIGDIACCLSLPTLELQWHITVDPATCFGLHYSERHHCLFSHGELEIARLNLNGVILWSKGGADIFTEGFEIQDQCIQAIDFNGQIYRMSFDTGQEY